MVFLSPKTLLPADFAAGVVQYAIRQSFVDPLARYFRRASSSLATMTITTDGDTINSAGVELKLKYAETEGAPPRWVASPRLSGFPLAANLSQPEYPFVIPTSDAFAVRRSAFNLVNGFYPSGCATLQDAVTDFSFRLLASTPRFSTTHTGVVVTMSSSSTEISEPFQQQRAQFIDEQMLPQRLNISVVWDLYCGCTGWNIEVANFAASLESFLRLRLVAGPDCFCPGFPASYSQALSRMSVSDSTELLRVDVFISHKPPDRYPRFPYRGNVRIEARPRRVIGRSMTGAHRVIFLMC